MLRIGVRECIEEHAKVCRKMPNMVGENNE